MSAASIRRDSPRIYCHGNPLASAEFLGMTNYNLRPQVYTITEEGIYKAAFKKFIPLFDRVLVQRMAAETKTKGGLLIPEKAQAKVQVAVVKAVGPGNTLENGSLLAPCVKVGERVLLPEYGGTKINLDDEEFVLVRDTDILGKYDS